MAEGGDLGSAPEFPLGTALNLQPLRAQGAGWGMTVGPATYPSL